MNKFFINIRIAFKVLRDLKNWPEYFLDYFCLLKEKFLIYELKNGLKFKARRGASDRGIVGDICLLEVYPLTKYYMPRNPIFIDLGAHIGVFSIFSVFKKNATVYAYEPFPDNFDLLLENIKLNKMENKIFPFNLAVSDLKNCRLYIAEENTGGHSIIIKSKKSIVVNSVSLEDIFYRNRIYRCDLLKLDIEGSEYSVLYNAPNEILKKIDKIYLECHDIKTRPGYNYRELKRFLEKNRFKVILESSPLYMYLYAIRF